MNLIGEVVLWTLKLIGMVVSWAVTSIQEAIASWNSTTDGTILWWAWKWILILIYVAWHVLGAWLLYDKYNHRCSASQPPRKEEEEEEGGRVPFLCGTGYVDEMELDDDDTKQDTSDPSTMDVPPSSNGQQRRKGPVQIRMIRPTPWEPESEISKRTLWLDC